MKYYKFIFIFCIVLQSQIIYTQIVSDRYLQSYEEFFAGLSDTTLLGLDELLILSNKISKRESFIEELDYQIKSYEVQLKTFETTINMLESELEATKKQYANLLYYSYLHSDVYNPLIYLLSAETLNQLYSNYKYLEILSEYRKMQVNSIYYTKTQLEYFYELVGKQQQIVEIYKYKYKNETVLLEADIDAHFNTIALLQQKKDDIRKHAEESIKLGEMLEFDVKETISKTETLSDNENTTGFLKLKGSLDLPVNGGILVRSFGEYDHPVLNEIKVKNDGIDIAPDDSYDVYCVADGIVTNIVTIPGMNNSVIIKHGDYFTVYTNLYILNVEVDEEVKKHDKIGSLNTESEILQLVNFQIWHLIEKLDPEDWIKMQ